MHTNTTANEHIITILLVTVSAVPERRPSLDTMDKPFHQLVPVMLQHSYSSLVSYCMPTTDPNDETQAAVSIINTVGLNVEIKFIYK